jgi:hypothetical protein
VLSDGDKDGQNEPTGDDAGGQGAPSTESIAPNLVESGMMEQIRSSAPIKLQLLVLQAAAKRKRSVMCLHLSANNLPPPIM